MEGPTETDAAPAPPGRRRRPLRKLLFVAIVVALSVHACWLEPSSLVVGGHRLQLPRWPAALAGLRVAVLADIHTGAPWNDTERLAELVERTNAELPDLILLGGDYVIHGVLGGSFVAPEESAAVLGGLRARLGVHAVLGNHDWWLDGPRVTAALESAGIPVLDDEAVRLGSGASAFWLVGLGDLWEGDHDPVAALSGVGDAAPVLLLTHNPDVFPDIPERVTLTIAGHTHGGQVRLPLLGRPIVPSRHGQRYAAGHVVEDGRHLFVSTGVGMSIIPVRFRVPPEITLLELHPEP